MKSPISATVVEQAASTVPVEKEVAVTGNLLLVYAFDIGDEIDLAQIRRQKLVTTLAAEPFPFFKNYHIPLPIRLETGERMRDDIISCKVHSFGTLSLCYKVPLSGPMEGLKLRVIELVGRYDAIANEDAMTLFTALRPAIREPVFFNLQNDYYAVQIEPNDAYGLSPEQFRKRYGPTLASLLRLETERLSEYQQSAILEATTGYYGRDFIVIDGSAAFIYDSDYSEALEFLEFANIQLMELQRFDQLLDQKLNHFYGRREESIPWAAYVPLLASKADTMLMDLNRLRVEVSVITERLANSIKLVGDAYYEELYAMLSDKLGLADWKQSIDEKLDIVDDLYTVRAQLQSTVREEMLTVVIIGLIAVEALIAFLTLSK